MKPARFDFIYIDFMKQDICIQTNTAFVFKALLFLVGNFDITVKYCTDEQILARRIFTHTHTLYRKKKKMFFITAPKTIVSMEKKCFVSITLSWNRSNCAYALYQTRRKECFPTARQEKSLEKTTFSRDVKRHWHYCKTAKKSIWTAPERTLRRACHLPWKEKEV